jgi:hypothetical protein
MISKNGRQCLPNGLEIFAKNYRKILGIMFIPQLLRSGSSPGSNYIEANESLGKKTLN